MTEYYVRVANNGMSLIEDFWAVEEGVAHQNIAPSRLGTHRANPGVDIMTTLQSRLPGSEFHRLGLGPGEYYPRIARPTSTRRECSPGHNPDQSDGARNTRTTSTGQLYALIQNLRQICQVVHPIARNFCAYGHEIGYLHPSKWRATKGAKLSLPAVAHVGRISEASCANARRNSVWQVHSSLSSCQKPSRRSRIRGID